jgi:hypothetical protein
VGLLVTSGFLVVFALAGLPIVYGAGAVADAVPWAGLAIGIVLAAAGIAALVGGRVALPVRSPVRVGRERGLATMVPSAPATASPPWAARSRSSSPSSAPRSGPERTAMRSSSSAPTGSASRSS